MFRTRTILVFALSSLLALPLTTTACNKGNSGPKTAQITPGEMPAGGEWTGVYYDPFYGNLHLIREGDMVEGRWRKESGDSWGELSGTIEGNLLRFEWVEHKIGMVGASAQSHGKGYFVYKEAPNPNEPDLVEGERGLNDNEVGSKWKGVKQANVVPDFDEVMPDEVEAPAPGGGWDDDGAAPKGDEDEPSVFGGGGDEEDDDAENDDGDTSF